MAKIKILYLSESAGDWGGASRVLFTNLKLLDKERFDLLVLLPRPGPIVPELERWGVGYRLWAGFTEFTDPWRYLHSLVGFYRLLKAERIDLIHANHAFWRPAGILAAKLARVTVIVHYHVVIDTPGPFLSLAQLIVANSRYTASVSKPESVPKSVVYNPVDISRFDRGRPIRDELGLPSDAIVIAFLGQIKRIKGVDLFLRMAKVLSQRHANLKFVLAGQCKNEPGAYREEELRAEIGDHPDIDYLGRRDDVENVYHSADIIVMPSRWDEPFGLVAVEAGACKKPIVATRVGGIPEIVEDGVNGFLVERDDLKGLVARVEQLIQDRDLRQRMGEAGRRKVEREFTIQPVRALEQIYLALCEQRR